MKLVLFGGSNTFMQRGYVRTTARALRDATRTEIETVNRAVGGTTSLVGLELASREPDPLSYTFVVIEYQINDLLLFARRDRGFWQRSVEGFVRLCRQRFRNAVIGIVILGRRNPKHWPAQDKAADDLRRIGAAYDHVTVIDIDGFIKETFGTDGDFARLYTDDPHYTVAVQCAVGVYVAMQLKAAMTRKVYLPFPESRTDPVLAPDPFDSVRSIELPDAHPGPRRQFKNSRFEYDCLVLEPGASLTLDLPGRALALTFMAAPGAGTLGIDVDLTTSHIHTLSGIVKNGKFPFLIKNHVFDWVSRSSPGRRVVLTARQPPLGAKVRPAHGMVAADEPGPVFLKSILVHDGGP